MPALTCEDVRLARNSGLTRLAAPSRSPACPRSPLLRSPLCVSFGGPPSAARRPAASALPVLGRRSLGRPPSVAPSSVAPMRVLRRPSFRSSPTGGVRVACPRSPVLGRRSRRRPRCLSSVALSSVALSSVALSSVAPPCGVRTACPRSPPSVAPPSSVAPPCLECENLGLYWSRKRGRQAIALDNASWSRKQRWR